MKKAIYLVLFDQILFSHVAWICLIYIYTQWKCNEKRNENMLWIGSKAVLMCPLSNWTKVPMILIETKLKILVLKENSYKISPVWKSYIVKNQISKLEYSLKETRLLSLFVWKTATICHFPENIWYIFLKLNTLLFISLMTLEVWIKLLNSMARQALLVRFLLFCTKYIKKN